MTRQCRTCLSFAGSDEGHSSRDSLCRPCFLSWSDFVDTHYYGPAGLAIDVAWETWLIQKKDEQRQRIKAMIRSLVQHEL